MLEAAIKTLEDQVQGERDAKPGTASWAVCQAYSLGLSFLRKAQALGIKDPQDLEKLRRRVRKDAVKDEEPEASNG